MGVYRTTSTAILDALAGIILFEESLKKESSCHRILRLGRSKIIRGRFFNVAEMEKVSITEHFSRNLASIHCTTKQNFEVRLKVLRIIYEKQAFLHPHSTVFQAELVVVYDG